MTKMKLFVGNRQVGALDGDVYTSPRSSDLYYIKGQGYPISESVLDTLVRNGCKTVVIEETRKNGTVHRYQCPLVWYLNGELVHEPPHDRQRNVKLRRLKHLESDDDGKSYQTRLV